MGSICFGLTYLKQDVNPSFEEDESSILADKRDMFHEACFKCTKCAKPLNSYVILDERKFSFLAPILATCFFWLTELLSEICGAGA